LVAVGTDELDPSHTGRSRKVGLQMLRVRELQLSRIAGRRDPIETLAVRALRAAGPDGELGMPIVEAANLPAINADQAWLAARMGVEARVAPRAMPRGDGGQSGLPAVLDMTARAGGSVALIGLMIRHIMAGAAGNVRHAEPRAGHPRGGHFRRRRGGLRFRARSAGMARLATRLEHRVGG